jgi:spheroidene monooxygenase
VLLLVRLKAGERWWGWQRVVRGGRALRGTPGLRFARALGSGQDGGFGLRPSLDRQGLFALFDTEDDARRFVDESPAVAAYRARADELLVAVLRATSCRGSWGGATMAVTATAAPGAPVAALTRASIRPLKARAFWRHSPPSEAALAATPGCRLAVGLGEAPLLRQATFSVWDHVAAMDAYARSGAHGEAIRAAMQGRWFSESMFVRFVPLRLEGQWKGRRFE